MKIYTFLTLAGIASWMLTIFLLASVPFLTTFCLGAAGWVFFKAAKCYALAEPTEEV